MPNNEPPLTREELDSIPANWPQTPEGWCDYWKIMDTRWATNQFSPLHHDSKCKLH